MKAKSIHDEGGSSVRSDSWAADLTPDQQWKLYRKARQSGDWTDAVAWAKEELHLGKSPSHSAFYRWMGTMRKAESEQRIEEMAIAVAEADALGKKLPTDKNLIATFKTLAVSAAVAGDAKGADTYVRIAGVIQKLHLQQLDFERKEEERREREKDDARLSDSFRKQLLMIFADKTGESYEEVARNYKASNAYIKKITDDMFAPPDQQAVNPASNGR